MQSQKIHTIPTLWIALGVLVINVLFTLVLVRRSTTDNFDTRSKAQAPYSSPCEDAGYACVSSSAFCTGNDGQNISLSCTSGSCCNWNPPVAPTNTSVPSPYTCESQAIGKCVTNGLVCNSGSLNGTCPTGQKCVAEGAICNPSTVVSSPTPTPKPPCFDVCTQYGEASTPCRDCLGFTVPTAAAVVVPTITPTSTPLPPDQLNICRSKCTTLACLAECEGKPTPTQAPNVMPTQVPASTLTPVPQQSFVENTMTFFQAVTNRAASITFVDILNIMLQRPASIVTNFFTGGSIPAVPASVKQCDDNGQSVAKGRCCSPDTNGLRYRCDWKFGYGYTCEGHGYFDKPCDDQYAPPAVVTPMFPSPTPTPYVAPVNAVTNFDTSYPAGCNDAGCCPKFTFVDGSQIDQFCDNGLCNLNGLACTDAPGQQQYLPTPVPAGFVVPDFQVENAYCSHNFVAFGHYVDGCANDNGVCYHQNGNWQGECKIDPFSNSGTIFYCFKGEDNTGVPCDTAYYFDQTAIPSPTPLPVVDYSKDFGAITTCREKGGWPTTNSTAVASNSVLDCGPGRYTHGSVFHYQCTGGFTIPWTSLFVCTKPGYLVYCCDP